MNIVEAIDDPHLLGASIRDAESWKSWRAFLAAAFGLPLDDYGAELFRQCTSRAELPTAAFQFIWLTIGRRGGKSFTMAMAAVFLSCFRDWRSFLSPGERAVVLLVAADREQARILRRYISGILQTPMLARLVESEGADAIELKGSVAIEIATCSFRLVRGRSVCAALLDEAAFWRSEGSANPDIEVFNAIRASMATFGDAAMTLVASSPYARRGLLWDAYRKWHGQDDPRNLVWQAATRVMNPSVEQSFIDAEYERDPASAAAEYGATFRTDIEAFVTREAVEAVVVPGRFELPPISGIRYHAFVDPSGGSQDAMTMAVAHLEDGVAILDAVREVKPPFSPEAVVNAFATLAKSYHCGSVMGDRYGGEFCREPFRKLDLEYRLAEKPRSDLYRDLLPMVNSGGVELLDHPRLVAQLCGLERRTARGGRDSIDHAPGQHDDVANAVAGALVTVKKHIQRPPIVAPILIPNPNSLALNNPFASGAGAQASHYFDPRNQGFTIK